MEDISLKEKSKAKSKKNNYFNILWLDSKISSIFLHKEKKYLKLKELDTFSFLTKPLKQKKKKP